MKNLAIMIVLLVFCHLASSIDATAEGLEIKLSGGYGRGLDRDYMGASSAYGAGGEVYSEDDVYFSAGQGAKINIALKYEMKNNLVLEIDSGYWFKSKTELKADIASQTATGKLQIGLSTIPLTFTCLVKTDLPTVSLYTGLGMGVYFVTMDRKESYAWPGHTAKYESEYGMEQPIGYHGIVGLESTLYKGLSYYCELRLTQLSCKITRFKITKAVEDEKDIIEEVDVDPYKSGNQSSVEFKADDRNHDPPFLFPASGLSIHLGIAYRLF